MTSLPQPTRSTSTSNASTTVASSLSQPPLRRNLFSSSSLSSRRPTPNNPAALSSVDSLQLGSEDASRGDILVRDPNGRVIMETLMEGMPPDLDENKDGDEDGAGMKLIELYRTHNRQRIDDADLKMAVQKSLKEKVASLSEDKWMYELDDDNDNING